MSRIIPHVIASPVHRRRRDTRGTLRRPPPTEACCASCAGGGPCAGACPAKEKPCCASCGEGGPCDSTRLPPAVYQGHVEVHEGARAWVVRARGRLVVKRELDTFYPGEEVVASVVEADGPRALRLLRARALGATGR
ncbi:MAG: hypothetical protein QUS11_04085, partial [Candidatus Fermentibacter sp.]|nr:hypothetical protein [Candidatus Fermentibacter sp.]